MAGHTDARKTFVGRPMVAGGIWRIPQHILLPTTAYAPRPESAIRLGGVSDEGYTYQSERSVDKKKDWNGDKVRSIQTDKDDTLELTFIEFLNPNVMALAYGESNVTVEAPTTQHGTHIAVRDVSDAYLKELAGVDKQKLQDRKGEIIGVRNACNVLTRNKVVPEEFALKAGLQRIISENGLEKKQ